MEGAIKIAYAGSNPWLFTVVLACIATNCLSRSWLKISPALVSLILEPHYTAEKSRALTEKRINAGIFSFILFFLRFVLVFFFLLSFFVREGKLPENIQRFHVDGDQNIQDLLIRLAPRR